MVIILATLITLLSLNIFGLEICNDYFKNSTYDILKMIQPYLPENPVILEAGSRFGEDTAKMSTFWPEGIIHAFEPLPTAFKLLQLNTQNKRNVFRYPIALGQKAEKHIFYVSSTNPGSSSLLKPNPIIAAGFDKMIEVETIRLDDWATQYKVKNIDLMWLDMEGAELIALQNGQTILKSVKVIFTEINFKDFREGAATYQSLNNFLILQGFREIWRRLTPTPDFQGDSIYIRA